MKIFNMSILWVCIVWASYGFATDDFDRDLYKYKSPTYLGGTVSFYRGSTTCNLQADHVVSLKDAHDSGASLFSPAEKQRFANDPENLVPACADVNQMKGARPPKDFWRLSNDNKGVEIDWNLHLWCRYVHRYYYIKAKYNLSFANNDTEIFKRCSPPF